MCDTTASVCGCCPFKQVDFLSPPLSHIKTLACWNPQGASMTREMSHCHSLTHQLNSGRGTSVGSWAVLGGDVGRWSLDHGSLVQGSIPSPACFSHSSQCPLLTWSLLSCASSTQRGCSVSPPLREGHSDSLTALAQRDQGGGGDWTGEGKGEKQSNR